MIEMKIPDRFLFDFRVLVPFLYFAGADDKDDEGEDVCEAHSAPSRSPNSVKLAQLRHAHSNQSSSLSCETSLIEKSFRKLTHLREAHSTPSSSLSTAKLTHLRQRYAGSHRLSSLSSVKLTQLRQAHSAPSSSLKSVKLTQLRDKSY